MPWYLCSRGNRRRVVFEFSRSNPRSLPAIAVNVSFFLMTNIIGHFALRGMQLVARAE